MMKKGLLNGRSSYKSDSDKGLNKKNKYITPKKVIFSLCMAELNYRQNCIIKMSETSLI